MTASRNYSINIKCANCGSEFHPWRGRESTSTVCSLRCRRQNTRPNVHSEAHPLSKLTQDAARSIRNDPRAAWKIAAEYGVSRSLIWGIKRGTHWKYA